jgi:hypothetical protein
MINSLRYAYKGMKMRIQRSILLILVALFCSQLAGCGSQQTTVSQGVSVAQLANRSQTAGPFLSQTDRWVPPVILRNPSPRQLEVFINVTMGGYDRTTRGTTMIGLDFQSSGRPVQFAGQERLICNGTIMPLHNRIAEFDVAEALTSSLEGKVFSCTYSAGSATATLVFTVPSAPVIRSPQDFAQLPRRTNTLISYHAQGGKLLGIVVLGPFAKALAHLDIPGEMQATVDTSAFPKGPGTISLSQALAFQVTQTGVPFKSLFAGGTAMAMVEVTWI